MSEETAPTTEQPESNLSLLAQEKFGHEFHGEATETPEVTEETPEEVIETAEEVVEEAEEEVVEEVVEHAEYEIDHIAELLGVEADDLDVNDDGKLVLNGKIDGQQAKTSAGELLKNFQMYQAAEKRLTEAKTKAQQANEESGKIVESANKQLAVASKMVENLESKLASEDSSINWATLREEDPAEYSAKKSELAEKRSDIENLKTDAVREYEESLREQDLVSQQQMQEYLQKENEALLTKLPDWVDAEKATEEKTQISKYLLSEGFTENDIANAADHRLIVLARKAMLFDQNTSKTDVAKKKVVKVPKVMKPGAPKTTEQSNNEKVTQLQSKLRKSGDTKDALALLKARRA